MLTISSRIKSYIAGFLDGDGCIMFQLIRRKDYVYGFQIRASIVFYQNSKNKKQLIWLKDVFQAGYLRDRPDNMSEYTIVGIEPVMKILKLLKPYVRLKAQHIILAGKIHKLLSINNNLNNLVKAAKLVDGFANLNYSKKRTNTSNTLIEYLRQHKLCPCND